MVEGRLAFPHSPSQADEQPVLLSRTWHGYGNLLQHIAQLLFATPTPDGALRTVMHNEGATLRDTANPERRLNMARAGAVAGGMELRREANAARAKRRLCCGFLIM